MLAVFDTHPAMSEKEWLEYGDIDQLQVKKWKREFKMRTMNRKRQKVPTYSIDEDSSNL